MLKNGSAHDNFSKDVLNWQPVLQKYATRLTRGGSEAEDLVQETIAKALNASERFHTGTNLKSWLFKIMFNTFCSAYKNRQREVLGLGDCAALHPSVPPSQEWAIRQSEVDEALKALPTSMREAVLIIACGTSYQDAAIEMNCEVGTVKSRVCRARSALVSALG
ncbi:sigma-70 family RNA polymerase sigma factor [Rhizobiaceae bacterium CRRU44]|uniref:RNA polymerase sigma factor n=1 Tax=Ferranicluibacter rubi TaxID=2715133 RepID=A0AA44CD70_9HYPH|nr:sigma-70 family RNA polymerase sigma factor [Ferranicluibacter rubi]NHT78574.1 sigma-70 family RNA polymerase sigma factor [Ferranicluibacter rubi]